MISGAGVFLSNLHGHLVKAISTVSKLFVEQSLAYCLLCHLAISFSFALHDDIAACKRIMYSATSTGEAVSGLGARGSGTGLVSSFGIFTAVGTSIAQPGKSISDSSIKALSIILVRITKSFNVAG